MNQLWSQLRFVLPLLCVGIVALAMACRDGGGGSGNLVDLPMLAVDCDWGIGAGEASGCGTSSLTAAPDVTARLKDVDAVCNGSAAGTLALGSGTVDCRSLVANECIGTVDTWTTPDGMAPLSELEAGDYLADVYIDTNDGGTLTAGEPVSCTEITLEAGVALVDIDFWMDFTL